VAEIAPTRLILLSWATDSPNGTNHHANCLTTSDETTAGDHKRVPVSGGVLVYEQRALGKELVGLEDVTDWENVADALRACGHDTGAVHHLPVLDK